MDGLSVVLGLEASQIKVRNISFVFHQAAVIDLGCRTNYDICLPELAGVSADA
jgi:hypothetical protein